MISKCYTLKKVYCIKRTKYVGLLLNAKQKTNGSSIVYADPAGTQAVSVDPESGQVFSAPFDANTNITNQINAVNFGLAGDTGLSKYDGISSASMNGDPVSLQNLQSILLLKPKFDDGKSFFQLLILSYGNGKK